MNSNPPIEMKVSGLGYLCVRPLHHQIEWLVVCKLDNEQIQAFNETREILNWRIHLLSCPTT